MSKLQNQNELNRRDFLKTSLVASVGAVTVGVAAAGENTSAAPSATPGSKTEPQSIIRVTNAKPGALLRKPWKNAIGVDVTVTLLRADLQSHLAKLQRDIGFRHCRTYAMFQDDMAVVTRRKDGSLAFRWSHTDKVLDALLGLGLRPFVNLSQMPVALASGTTTLLDWEVNTTPPRDYAEWGQLVGAFARHCLDRYGLDEIAQWYYEVWNEPNIQFWTGSQAEYWKLYDASARALKAVSPRLRVGGPVSARAAWIPEMISHCSSAGVPLDFISTHIYPQDEYRLYSGPQGSPYKPGMFVPDVVREVRQTVRQSALPDLEIHWTEWSSSVPVPDGKLSGSKHPTLDDLSGAANACYLATAVDGDCDTFAWWPASDIDGQNGIPQSEFSHTHGLLTLSGLPKATFNAFSFLNRLRGGRLEVRHETLAPGRGLVATAEGESVQVLLWHRILLEVGAQQPWAGVLELPWTKSARPVLPQERITAGAGSCYETWQALGAPQNLSATERRLLEVHAAPEARLFQPEAQNGRVTHEFRLAPGEVLYCELRPQGAVALPKSPLRQELKAWYASMNAKSK
ncbi:MAG: twin-arginine translocation signal domain-containing protein [Verrucomicrobiota bacterium]|jgi:xylan 1,4-beta-xylosidase